MYYRHNLNFNYPEQSDEHMLVVKRVKKINFDENYPYLDKRFPYKFKRGVFATLLNLIIFPLLNFSHGLRIYGKKNIKKYKKELQGGAITISNHVFMWDFLCVLKAVRPHLCYFPAWKTNFEGPMGGMVRMAGGIPVPTDSIRAMIKFNRAMEELMENGKWIHFFPEGSMWSYYPDIRPLKKQVFKYAVKFDKPIIPISMSFRPRRGIMKLFSKKPLVDLHIGEPMFRDQNLSDIEAEQKMHADAYHILQVMNGINPGDPTYNTDQKIANYRCTMKD